MKAIGAVILLALGGLPPSGPAFAQAKDQAKDKAPDADRPLLATFCDAACTKGFPRPKEIFGELGPGEAYVPPGHEKKARFVIDLQTSKAVPEAEFGKP